MQGSAAPYSLAFSLLFALKKVDGAIQKGEIRMKSENFKIICLTLHSAETYLNSATKRVQRVQKWMKEIEKTGFLEGLDEVQVMAKIHKAIFRTSNANWDLNDALSQLIQSMEEQ